MKHFSTTNYTNYTNWLRRSWRVLLLLAIFNCQLSIVNSVRAQDAFYIYRNDGDFDGFFYDQVVRMGYSKYDLDSIEHDVYVVQEVVTADSLYRIPLAAIDSIGFQQPEIRFSPMLKNMDELGMTPYVKEINVNQYGNSIVFKDLPSSLLPQVGDVLLSFSEELKTDALWYQNRELMTEIDSNDDYVHLTGIVGKVTRISDWGDGNLRVSFDLVEELGDVFDQLITVEQLGTDAKGNVVRRVAGFNPDGTLKSPRRVGGNTDVTLFSWSGRLQKEWKPFAVAENYYSINAGLDLGLEAKAQVVYNVSGVFKKRFYMKLVLSQAFSAALSAQIQFTTGGAMEWPITTPLNVISGIKFPAVFPIFEVNPTPEGFFRIVGNIDATLKLPELKFGMAQTITIDSEDPWLMSFKWGNRDKQSEGYKFVEGDFGDLNAGITFSGFIQAGAKATLGLSTNSWLSKLLHAGVGLEIYAGPKLKGAIEFPKLSVSSITLTPLSFDRELKYKWRVGSKKEERTLWSDSQEFFSTRLTAAPECTDFNFELSGDKKSVTATVQLRGKVFAPNELSMELRSDSWSEYIQPVIHKVGSYNPLNSANKVSTTFPLVWGGYYVVDLKTKFMNLEETIGSGPTPPEIIFVPIYEHPNVNAFTVPYTGGTVTITSLSNSPIPWGPSGDHQFWRAEHTSTTILDDKAQHSYTLYVGANGSKDERKINVGFPKNVSPDSNEWEYITIIQKGKSEEE